MRNRGYYRHHRQRVINRKKKLMKHRGWKFKFDGMYSKNKIHCSCVMCNYDKVYGYDRFRYRKSEYFAKMDLEYYSSKMSFICVES